MAPSRGLRRVLTGDTSAYICSQCRRCNPSIPSRAFTTTPPRLSGHSRWSKIKHDKAKVDAGKNRARSVFAHELATASKMFGSDPNMNPRLADLITKAKREGFAKASIEAAIARGQGRSVSGASLESVSVEAMLPSGVAIIVECETDSKLRTLSEVRHVIKESGGNATPTSYLFAKKGRIVLESKDGVGMDEVLEPALEAGATDVAEDEDGRVVVFAEPAETSAVGDAISKALDVQISSSEVIWDPNEDTKVEVPDEKVAEELGAFVDELQEREMSVQSVAMNVAQGTLAAEAWKDLQSRLGA